MAYYVTKSMSDIVTEALRILNKVEGQSAADAIDLTRGARHLQMMLESWQTLGVSIWMRRREDIYIADGVADYDLASEGFSASELLFASLVGETDTAESETPLRIISRDDYLNMNNKLTEAAPTHVWPSIDEDDTFTLTFWPTPDDTYKVKLDYRKRFTNATSTSTEIEIPRHWLRATIWCLAEELLVPYGVFGTPRGQKIEMKARELFDTAAAFDNIQDGGGEVRFMAGA